MRIDLHLHSNVSDGTGSPSQVMREAADAGLDVVALADHDTTDGWDEAQQAADAVGLRFIPAIEVSAHHGHVSVHLLAYWPRRDDPALLAMLQKTQEARIGRARRMVDRIAVDYPIEWADVEARAGSAATVGRPHIADALVARGAFQTRDEVFQKVLANRSPYYVRHYAPGVVEAIDTVRSAGGVTVFAHPGAHARGRTVPDWAIAELAKAGLSGLEVDHRDHDDATRAHLAELAERYGLLQTGSSDYHGTGKLNRLGENLTDPEVLQALEALRG